MDMIQFRAAKLFATTATSFLTAFSSSSSSKPVVRSFVMSLPNTPPATVAAARVFRAREAKRPFATDADIPPEKREPLLSNHAKKSRKIKSSSRTKSSSSSAAAKEADLNGSKSDSGGNSNVPPQQPQPWYHSITKGDAEYDRYMSEEWGLERRGDTALFEKLTLEGAQSGLSWLTILRKREAYRRTFHQFDVAPVAAMTAADVDEILLQGNDSSKKSKTTNTTVVVRHRGKIESTIHNAKCILQMHSSDDDNDDGTDHSKLPVPLQSEYHGVLDQFLWSFVGHKPILNRVDALDNAPSTSPESHAMSQGLKQRGFKFVGPTTCYALMQATGMILDHIYDTPEYHVAKRRLQERRGGYQDRTQEVGTLLANSSKAECIAWHDPSIR